MTAQSSAISLIVNRHAGRFGTSPSVDELVALLRRHGLRPEPILIKKGQNPGEAARAALGGGAQTLVAAGGDGTISSVAAALIDSEATLGVLPIGTLNHFAKDLRIPLDMEGAAGVLANGRVAKIDAGEVNGRVFINNSGIGVYPRMVKWREEYRRMGATQLTALFWAAVTAVRRMPFLRLRLTAAGTDVTLVTPLIFVGNNEYEVEGFTSGRRRRVDGGQLFLCAVHATAPTRLIRLSLMALLGRIRQDVDFHSVCVTEAWIETRRQWVRVSLDGEVVRLETPLHYRTRPGALRVLVPREEIVSEP
jgi:diacylglycerol kinase family enzyme